MTEPPVFRIACHRFEGTSLDARCTETHTQVSAERCRMTRAWLHEAPKEDVGRYAPDVPWCGHGQFNTGEWEEIQRDKERTRDAAWNAVVGVCSH